jgi:hypothetical protein
MPNDLSINNVLKENDLQKLRQITSRAKGVIMAQSGELRTVYMGHNCPIPDGFRQQKSPLLGSGLGGRRNDQSKA